MFFHSVCQFSCAIDKHNRLHKFPNILAADLLNQGGEPLREGSYKNNFFGNNMKKLSLLIAALALFSTVAQADNLTPLERARANAAANGSKVVVVNPANATAVTTATTDDLDTTTNTAVVAGTTTTATTAGRVGVRGVNNVNTGTEVNVNQKHTARNAGAAKYKRNPNN